jgi:uncharacterized protein YhbP (UPF0306 family)
MSGPVAALLITLVLAVAGLVYVVFRALAFMVKETHKAHELIAQTNSETAKNVAILMEAFLKQAQGMQALGKLKDLEDEKVQRIFDKFKAAPMASAPGHKEQIDRIKRTAEQLGIEIETKPVPRSEAGPLIPPIPDPLKWDGSDLLVIE